MIRSALVLGTLLASSMTAFAAPAPPPTKPAPMDYVEFSVSDIARAKAFYGAIFGWTFTDYGPTYTSFIDNGLGGGFTTNRALRLGGPLMVFHEGEGRGRDRQADLLIPRRTTFRVQRSGRL